MTLRKDDENKKGETEKMNKDILQIFAEGASGDSAQEAGIAEAASAEDSTAEKGNSSTEEEFEALIKGKYSDAFSKRTQGIIDKRFAKMKVFEKKANACEPLLKILGEQYPGIDAADTEKLVAAFINGTQGGNKSDNDTVKQEEKKVSPAKAAEGLIQKRAAENLSAYLSAEQEKLREIYPSFSLEEELKNSPEFRHLLTSGVSLRRAFETVNLEKIMGSALRYAVMSAGKKTADSIKNSKRVNENSLQDSASSVKRTDVNSLTEKDIMRILSQVSKGAKISF